MVVDCEMEIRYGSCGRWEICPLSYLWCTA